MSLPYGLDLNDQINIDKSSTRMIVTIENVRSSRLRELQDAADVWMKKNTPQTMWTTPASTSLMFAHISKRNIRSSLIATAIAILLISLVLAFAFRSLRYGLISLIPNIVPAVVTFGIWGLSDGQINVALATSATLSLDRAHLKLSLRDAGFGVGRKAGTRRNSNAISKASNTASGFEDKSQQISLR